MGRYNKNARYKIQEREIKRESRRRDEKEGRGRGRGRKEAEYAGGWTFNQPQPSSIRGGVGVGLSGFNLLFPWDFLPRRSNGDFRRLSLPIAALIQII